MKVYDPGHIYSLRCLDGEAEEILKFVKRNLPPENYPGNNSSYPGTTIQEVCRALIDCLKYVSNQTLLVEGNKCNEDEIAIHLLRKVIYLLECRAAARHQLQFPMYIDNIENADNCNKCGHIICSHMEVA